MDTFNFTFDRFRHNATPSDATEPIIAYAFLTLILVLFGTFGLTAFRAPILALLTYNTDHFNAGSPFTTSIRQLLSLISAVGIAVITAYKERGSQIADLISSIFPFAAAAICLTWLLDYTTVHLLKILEQSIHLYFAHDFRSSLQAMVKTYSFLVSYVIWMMLIQFIATASRILHHKSRASIILILSTASMVITQKAMAIYHDANLYEPGYIHDAFIQHRVLVVASIIFFRLYQFMSNAPFIVKPPRTSMAGGILDTYPTSSHSPITDMVYRIIVRKMGRMKALLRSTISALNVKLFADLLFLFGDTGTPTRLNNFPGVRCFCCLSVWICRVVNSTAALVTAMSSILTHSLVADVARPDAGYLRFMVEAAMHCSYVTFAGGVLFKCTHLLTRALHGFLLPLSSSTHGSITSFVFDCVATMLYSWSGIQGIKITKSIMTNNSQIHSIPEVVARVNFSAFLLQASMFAMHPSIRSPLFDLGKESVFWIMVAHYIWICTLLTGLMFGLSLQLLEPQVNLWWYYVDVSDFDVQSEDEELEVEESDGDEE